MCEGATVDGSRPCQKPATKIVAVQYEHFSVYCMCILSCGFRVIRYDRIRYESSGKSVVWGPRAGIIFINKVFIFTSKLICLQTKLHFYKQNLVCTNTLLFFYKQKSMFTNKMPFTGFASAADRFLIFFYGFNRF